jgi:hypothetical protein
MVSALTAAFHCAALVDEPRDVAGDEGGGSGAKRYPDPRAVRLRTAVELDLERIPLASHRRAYRHFPLRWAPALRRVRR